MKKFDVNDTMYFESTAVLCTEYFIILVLKP